MHTKKVFWILINILGGTAVIGSYIFAFLSYPDASELLWGGVPTGLRTFYTVSMFLAAAGYLTFSYFLLHWSQKETMVFGRFGFGILNVLYLLILIPSALWMPVTLLAIERSSPVWSLIVKADLAVVALASLGMLIALLKIQPRPSRLAHLIVVLGCLFLCFQTVILDAIVWAAFFGG